MLVGTWTSNSRPNNVALDDDANLRELEQLVDKLQTVNRTLTSMYSHSLLQRWSSYRTDGTRTLGSDQYLCRRSRLSPTKLHCRSLFLAIDASLTNSTSDGNLI